MDTTLSADKDGPTKTMDFILPPLTEQPGDRIGRYKLLQEIGSGGFGIVYMAEQAQPVRRRVALKIIKLGMDTRQVIARFEAERHAAMNLVARSLAASDASEIRNGANAVPLAENAVAATSRTNASFLETLAAAYAETHRFDRALAVEQEAMSLAKNEQEKKHCASLLKLYQANTPYREKADAR
jgi:serine/threonine protein kinase